MTDFDPLRAVREKDSRLEDAVGAWLHRGVRASVVVIAAGLLVSLVRHPDYLTDPAAFQRLTAPGTALPHSLAGIAGEFAELRGRAIITLGILIMIATPLIRVVISVVVFARNRDGVYTAITLAVLIALLISVGIGAVL